MEIFTNQPATKLYNLNSKKLTFVNAQKVEDLGFFIGLHTNNIQRKTLNRLVNALLRIDTI